MSVYAPGALTGYIADDSPDSEAVFDCHLVKPPSLEDLAEVLKADGNHGESPTYR